MDNATNTAWLAGMMNGEARETTLPFRPVAQYHPEMDCMLYLREDCSYRADRVDLFLTLLWHPYEQRAVGIKLKGFRFLFEQVRRIHNLQPEGFISVATALEISLAGGIAETIMNDAARSRVVRLYDEARRVVASDARLPATELLQAAA
ncbi:MAG: hypothetical protein WCK01_00330 [Candidatus Uhrbacteria bacterium]